MNLPAARAGHIDGLPPGAIQTVTTMFGKVLLSNVDGAVRAVRAECSHEGAPLHEGEIEGETVECPWHFSRFCLRTGDVLELPATDPLETFDVEVRDGNIFLSQRTTSA